MIYDEGIGLVLYDYIPNKESLNLIINTMKQNLELEKTTKVKKLDFSIEHPFKLTTIGNNVKSSTQTYTLLPNFVGQSESYARNWLANNGLSASITTKEVSSGYYDGQIISQSYPESKRIDLINGSVNLTVAKVIQTQSQTPKTNNNTNKSNKNTKQNKNNNTPNNNQDKNDDNQTKDDTNTTLPPEIIE